MYYVKSFKNQYLVMSFDPNDHLSEVFLSFYNEFEALRVCNSLNIDDISAICLSDILNSSSDTSD